MYKHCDLHLRNTGTQRLKKMTSCNASSRLLLVALVVTLTITVYGDHQLRLSNPNGGAQRTGTSSKINGNERQAGSQILQNGPGLVNDLPKVYKNNNKRESSSFTSSTETTGTKYGIPQEFLTNDINLLSNDEPKYQPFPRWQNRTKNEYELTMMEALLDFVNATSVSYKTIHSNMDARLTDHKHDLMGKTPEVFYVLRKNGMYVTQTGLSIYVAYGMVFQKKTNAIHSLMKRSYDKFLSNTTMSRLKWPRLYQLLVTEKRDVPFLMWFLDYTGCNLYNWRENQSVPLFTMAANVDCQYTFPIPTYETYVDSVESEQVQSRNNDNNNAATTPIDVSIWKAKNATVMWRGGLTGQKRQIFANDDIEVARGIRYRLLKLINSDKLSEEERRLFDVKATYLAFLEDNKDLWPVLGYRGEKVDYVPKEMQDSYRVLLDIDGYSWSARFGNLLGKQSVILKIEPQEVDYFHFKRSKDDGTHKLLLEPWKHYIPVKRDFSDLVEKAKYALSDNNADHIVQIISNANEWHRTNMVKDVVASDLLDIWESYVTILDTYSLNWIDQWERNQQTIMSDVSLNMSLLQEFI